MEKLGCQTVMDLCVLDLLVKLLTPDLPGSKRKYWIKITSLLWVYVGSLCLRISQDNLRVNHIQAEGQI